jgi:hypothetical protein
MMEATEEVVRLAIMNNKAKEGRESVFIMDAYLTMISSAS